MTWVGLTASHKSYIFCFRDSELFTFILGGKILFEVLLHPNTFRNRSSWVLLLFYLPVHPLGNWDMIQLLSSVQISCSVVSDSLWPHELQHARPPCPSPPPGLHSDPCPSSQQCHPAISSSVVTFSSCPQSLPASESFPMSQLFTWGGKSTGASALASFLPKKSQGWSSEWTGWISLQSKGLSRVFSNKDNDYGPREKYK